jgi:hypothetical protein
MEEKAEKELSPIGFKYSRSSVFISGRTPLHPISEFALESALTAPNVSEPIAY